VASKALISPADLLALALEMKSAQDATRQIEPFSARVPDFDLEDAYQVCGLIHEARVGEGAKPVGRKIGFTNPAMWPIFGVAEPIWGHVYDRTVVLLDGTAATCPLAPFAEPMIEPEIVLHFRAAPRPGDGLAGILGAIDWVAHGFEIVQSHFPGWKFKAPDTVADGGLHGSLLVGPRVPVGELGSDPVKALEAFTLELSCDGRPVETGRGSNVLGNPLAAITHLLSALEKQPHAAPLEAGELVTTGTITTAHPVHAGETWRTGLQGIPLPGLELRFLP
jgi:2-oxo-3-hexenedioate decarboxylase